MTEEQFSAEVESIFDLRQLEVGREPIDLGELRLLRFPDLRVNHYLSRSDDDCGFIYGEPDKPEVRYFVGATCRWAGENDLTFYSRYCYVTIDQGWVAPGSTQRHAGWHLDHPDDCYPCPETELDTRRPGSREVEKSHTSFSSSHHTESWRTCCGQEDRYRLKKVPVEVSVSIRRHWGK